MPADLVIRGGTVIDGTGVPGRVADVAITDRVIREIGPNLDGADELDATGCVVAPGFIDIHTHYDAQVFWDPALRPTSYHGVTTVIAGNCGFAIAPTRPEHREMIVHTLENVEDMDPATLFAGVVWDFETFPEYLDAVHRRGTVLNFAAYCGHSALRIYVMGEAAYERAATPDEIARMCELVREAIGAGAAGFSTSFSYAHRGVDGKPVPSRFAEADEVAALFDAAGAAGKGVILITPGKQCTYADVYEWQPRVGRPFTYPMFAAPGGKHLEPLALHEQGLARGAQVWPQVTPRPLTMQFTMADAYSLNTGKIFGELMKGTRDARLAAYRDPDWRARAAADLEESPMRPRWETFEVSESEQFPELQGQRVTDLARERGCGPLDVLCEIAVAEDLETRFRAYIANDDVDAVGRLLTHDHMALGLSDAGAHVDQLCDAPLPTDLLGRWVRDRNVMPLEQAVRKLTGEPADMFGFVRRGYLRAGYWADVCVFDPQTVGPGPTRRVRDFPADAERLTAEEPTGVRHVLVNGSCIRRDGQQLDADDRPGARPEFGAIEPFRVAVDDEVLDDLRRRLEHSRLPDEIEGTGWEYGIPIGYLRELVQYWRDEYDWRAQEARLNAFAQFRTEIDGQSIHFVHVRSANPDVRPLLLAHGWPGSIVEFLDVIPRLTGSFHVVVPSLPGYGFSGPTNTRGWDTWRIAGAFAELMRRLGYAGYGAQGGDWGAQVATRIAASDPEHCLALHLNMAVAEKPADTVELTDADRADLAAMAKFAREESGYSIEQSTKPQTLGAGLSDSPAGLLAWIVEKFRAWSDCDGDPETVFTRDQLITNVMIYWVTGTSASSARLYWEHRHRGSVEGAPDFVAVPTGVARYPKEVVRFPRSWVERRYNITHWVDMPRGGHFAAMEQPELFADDLLAFFRPLLERVS